MLSSENFPYAPMWNMCRTFSSVHPFKIEILGSHSKVMTLYLWILSLNLHSESDVYTSIKLNIGKNVLNNYCIFNRIIFLPKNVPWRSIIKSDLGILLTTSLSYKEHSPTHTGKDIIYAQSTEEVEDFIMFIFLFLREGQGIFKAWFILLQYLLIQLNYSNVRVCAPISAVVVKP